MKIRLAKYLSDNGIASRRQAENLISSGHISVNGKIITTPVFFVDGTEKILVDNKAIEPQTEIQLYMFHKPINTITSTYDPNGRKTIYDCLDKNFAQLKYVGRLDYKTTGLLLLTNDGQLARKLTLPSSHITKTYIAKIKNLSDEKLNKARAGICIDGIKYRPMNITVLNKETVKIKIDEGKKNEIRIVFKCIGCPIIDLHRIEFGNIQLKNLPIGKIIKIDKKTIDLLKKNL